MKIKNDEQLSELSMEEMISIQGGSEFSESVFKTIGWIVGGIVGVYQSAHAQQVAEINAGLSPRDS
jgi:hypothetical protein